MRCVGIASVLTACASNTPPPIAEWDGGWLVEDAGEGDAKTGGSGSGTTGSPNGTAAQGTTGATNATQAETGAPDDSVAIDATMGDDEAARVDLMADGGLAPPDGSPNALSGADAALDGGDDGSSRGSIDGGQDDSAVPVDASALEASSEADASDSGAATDAAPDSGALCAPGCPANVSCGHYVDCTGALLACGSPCGKGESCLPNGGGQSCQAPPPCNGSCGTIAVDQCGVAIGCGGCAAGNVCLNNGCVTASSVEAGACTPLACTLGNGTNLCGTVSDGCGHSKSCGCPAGDECINGACQQTPPECGDADGGAGSVCGSVENACGSGTVSCGNCAGANECKKNVCAPCTPPSCGAAVCGSVSNGCGPNVSCGTCAKGEDCSGGACCTPMTCAEAQSAGMVTGCAPVSLGCGIEQSCAPCASGDICTANACVTCVAKTCTSFGNAGCNHGDGCGHTLDCCSGSAVCTSGLCCQPGEVSYQGACCQPQCSEDLPAGPQVSCGVTLNCSGS
jgi:hypothetical protein